MKKISIVIPCYNEEENVIPISNAVIAEFQKSLPQYDYEIVFIDNFNTVKVCTDINTLTSFSLDKGKEYSKNRVMRVLNQYCNDAYRQLSLHYLGKINNDENGRNLIKGWNVGYLNEMQANGGIRDFQPEDVTVNSGDDVDSIVLNVALMPVDSIEKIYASVTVSIGTRAK